MKNLLFKVLKLIIKPRHIPLKEINIATAKKILIIRQHDPLGDVIISTAAVSAIKEYLSTVIIDIVVRPDTADVFKNHHAIRNIYIYDKKSPYKILKFIKNIKREKYDLAITLNASSFSLTSALISYLSNSNIRIGYDSSVFGYKEYSKLLFTTEVAFPKKIIREVDKHLYLLDKLGIETNSKNSKIYLSKEEKENAKEILSKLRKTDNFLICIHPGAGKIENRWNIKRFAMLHNRIKKELKTDIIVAFGKKENDLKEDFIKYADFPIVLPILSFREFAAVLSLTDILICNDTAPLHIGAAVGICTIAIFGPTNPYHWNPYGNRHLFLRRNNMCDSVTVNDVFDLTRKIIQNSV